MGSNGKILLLLLAVGLILIGTSGKGLEVWQVITGKTVTTDNSTTGTPKESNPTDLEEIDKGSGSGGAGSGGVRT